MELSPADDPAGADRVLAELETAIAQRDQAAAVGALDRLDVVAGPAFAEDVRRYLVQRGLDRMVEGG